MAINSAMQSSYAERVCQPEVRIEEAAHGRLWDRLEAQMNQITNTQRQQHEQAAQEITQVKTSLRAGHKRLTHHERSMREVIEMMDGKVCPTINEQYL